jgi:hypothetical protein
VLKFRGAGIVDEEIVNYKGEGSRVVEWVWWRKSMGMEVSENPCWMLGEKSDKTKLG